MLNQGVWRDVIRTVQMIPAPSKNYMQVIQTLLFCKPYKIRVFELRYDEFKILLPKGTYLQTRLEVGDKDKGDILRCYW